MFIDMNYIPHKERYDKKTSSYICGWHGKRKDDLEGLIWREKGTDI